MTTRDTHSSSSVPSARTVTRDRIETLISVIDEHLAFQRSDEGLGLSITQMEIAKETKALLTDVSSLLTALADKETENAKLKEQK